MDKRVGMKRIEGELFSFHSFPDLSFPLVFSSLPVSPNIFKYNFFSSLFPKYI